MEQASLATKLGQVFGSALVNSLYVRNFVAYLKPGPQRLAASLPSIAFHCLAPFTFNLEEDLILRLSATYLLVWMANFKVFALSIDRGPLSLDLTFGQWLVVLYLPMQPQEQQQVLLGAVVFTIRNIQLPIMVEHYLWALAIYAFMAFMTDLHGIWVEGLLGLKIVPYFDQPWLTASISEFWGKRWNIPTSSILRTTVYHPILEGSLLPRPAARQQSGWARRSLASLLAFCASGAMHEIILAYISAPAGGVWFMFFLVQWPLVTAEQLLGSLWQRRKLPQLPLVLRMVLSQLLLELTAAYFFFPPVYEHKLPQRMGGMIAGGYVAAGAQLKELAAWLAQ